MPVTKKVQVSKVNSKNRKISSELTPEEKRMVEESREYFKKSATTQPTQHMRDKMQDQAGYEDEGNRQEESRALQENLPQMSAEQVKVLRHISDKFKKENQNKETNE